ncbi:MAG: hypothetical protein BWY15_00947 [Firmicutes bacterium ADurb.Bin193]|nr:MAG: hypothetical protein BWY15_00947 [Firmicutes bacterium ADurb.Bin193]
MLKRICSLVFITALLLNTTVFAHTATVTNSGTNRYKSVRLTPEICNNANENLSDVLVKDDNGEIVPYFINTSRSATSKENYTYTLALINSYTKDDSFYFDYRIAKIPSTDVIATSIVLTTKTTGFAKKIEVFGSYDNRYWEKIKDDTLYSVDGKTKLEIVFGIPQKYTHYRFKLGNNLEKIAFDTATLYYSVTSLEKSYFAEEISPKFSIEQKEKETHVYIEGLKNLFVDTITIKTNSMFKRNAVVEGLGITAEIYNLSFGDTTYTDTDIVIRKKKIENDVLTIIIKNNDDKPISIDGITAKYYAEEIVFEDNGSKNYYIEFAKNDSAKAPIYDIASYKDDILKGAVDSLTVREVKLDEIPKEPKQYDYNLIFNIVIVAVAVLLGLLILLKLKKKPE